MKLALHRSITFWSGILVMVFIVWTWWQSIGTFYNWSLQSWMVGNLDSYVAIGKADWGSAGLLRDLPADPTADRPTFQLGSPVFIRFKPSPPGPALSWAWDRNTEMWGDPGDLNSRRYGVLMMSFSFLGGSVLLIPHWLILIAFAMLWMVLLLWRARRTRRSGSQVEPAIGSA